ncbi:MAG: hypothetical protein KatS3mg083_511 [Candidatus Dojkabacteria bacterium]|nr:MAG: hypothetical protein KatS3mg083_511 [Candidatus Dojkabacteria bacterium]
MTEKKNKTTEAQLKNPHALVFEKVKQDDKGTHFRVGLSSAAETAGYKLVAFKEPSVVEGFEFNEEKGVAKFILPKGIKGARLRFDYETKKGEAIFTHVRFEHISH